MGPLQDPPERRANQERSCPPGKRLRRRPRRRLCLLKGCKQRFRAKHPRSRYCSDDCRREALRWSRWKAQKQYRSTGSGKKKRREQSRRHRKRASTRKRLKSAAQGPARVITSKFFRMLLRPAGLLRPVCSNQAFSPAALLFEGMPACSAARAGAGTALEGTPSAQSIPAALAQDRSFSLMKGSW